MNEVQRDGSVCLGHQLGSGRARIQTQVFTLKGIHWCWALPIVEGTARRTEPEKLVGLEV